MSGWFGPLDGLVPVYSTPSMSITPEVERSYQTTLGGRRFVRSAPRGHREWAMEAAGAQGTELLAVESFAAGYMGAGPWWWLSPWAVGVNALTPEGSLLMHASQLGSVTSAGPVKASDGATFPMSIVVASSALGIARSSSSTFIAIPPGVRVSASVYGSPGQNLVAQFLNASGAAVGNAQRAASHSSGLARLTAVGTAPATATRLRLDVSGSGVMAGASVSFTDKAVPWSLGDGCEAAVVDSESRTIDVVGRNPHQGQSFTVREVG